jgi:hypothetical protein
MSRADMPLPETEPEARYLLLLRRNLQQIADARHALDEEEFQLVDEARRDGITWRVIAVAHGWTSPQAAQQHQSRLQAAVSKRATGG